jgi:hypothetical protein
MHYAEDLTKSHPEIFYGNDVWEEEPVLCDKDHIYLYEAISDNGLIVQYLTRNDVNERDYPLISWFMMFFSEGSIFFSKEPSFTRSLIKNEEGIDGECYRVLENVE